VARIDGFLEDVKFKEGDVVKEGTPLCLIEQGLYKASVEQAQGSLERAQAAKALTEIQLQRAQLRSERLRRALRARARPGPVKEI
jgi:membrane fusion protein (multidrug efflux system)